MHLARSIALAVTSVLTISLASNAFAQSTGAVEPSSTGKGIVGGTLLGAEIVLLTEAAIDVSPDWLYYVGGAAGAVGGGVAGYFLEDSLSSKANMFLLAGGMLLVIPTTVAVLSATAYEQSAEYTQDQAPKDEPAADPAIPTMPATTAVPAPAGAVPPSTTPAAPTPATTTPAPTVPASQAPLSFRSRKQRRLSLPTAFVGIDAQNHVHWGIPAVEVRDAYSRLEIARFGVQQRTEVRVPLLRMAF
ncbi:MAG TPA: hypothetical protein VIV60_34850 [Polyangiaceae bacterium]